MSVPCELTEEQQWVLCLAAGVPMRTEFDDETRGLRWTTIHPCAVVEVEPGMFTVFVNPNIVTD